MGVSVIGLRYFNVFGMRQSKEYAGVIKLFLERIKDKLPPKINEILSYWWCWFYW